MDDELADELNQISSETLAEMQSLNEKMDKLLNQMERIQSWLVKIEMNTKPSGLPPGLARFGR